MSVTSTKSSLNIDAQHDLASDVHEGVLELYPQPARLRDDPRSPTDLPIMIQISDRTLQFLASLLVLGAASCGGGGGGGGGSNAPAAVDVLIRDAPVDDLSSFSITVAELRLLDGLGAPSANLLSAPVTLELLGLQTSSAWVASVAPPTGTWSGLRVAFTPGSSVARADDGTPVAVTEAATTFDAAFSAPVVTGATGYDRLVVDVDLASSLAGNVTAPPILFDPEGTVASSTGSEPIDEIKGIVQAIAAGNSELTIDAFADGDLSLPLGEVRVRVSGSTLLLADDDLPFASTAAFFAALVPSQTLLEVHGQLGNQGVVQATRIEIEDQDGGVSSSSVVEIEGRIVGLDTMTSTFDLLIQEIEKGGAIANPVLSGLGNPATIAVTYDAMTVFIEDESNQLLTSALLAVGVEVDVKFPTFINPPFAASEVEVDDGEIDYEGFVVDTSGLPQSMTIQLKASDTAVQAGLVASSSTDVVVDTSSAPFTLDVDDDPSLSPSEVQVGLRVEVKGTLSGPPSAPTIDATEVEVRPGKLEGTVMAVNPGLGFFQVGVSSIDDPFASNVTSGPIDVLIDGAAIFDGDAESQAAFFELFAGLQSGEELEVEIEGIGSGNANEIVAFEIDSEVE